MIRTAEEFKILQEFYLLEEVEQKTVIWIQKELERIAKEQRRLYLSLSFKNTAEFATLTNNIRPLEGYIDMNMVNVAEFLKKLKFRVKLDTYKKVLEVGV